MPKITAPMLSFGGAGQIGKSMVFSKWKGVPYVRQYVIPANPRTIKQTANRAVFTLLNSAYLYAPAAIKQAFDAYAIGKPLTGRNKFFQDNMKLLGVDPKPAGLDGLIVSPGNGGGLPPTNMSAVGGTLEIDVTVTLPDVPAGWTLVASIAAAVEQQSPAADFSGKWFVVTKTVSPGAVTITGLAAATEYVVGIFLKWEKPDGSIAYSVSLSDTAVTD